MRPLLKGFISARDSVDLIVQDEGDQCFRLFVTGFEYGPLPPQPKYIRVNTYPSGMIIRKTAYPEISNVTTYFQVDLNFPRTPQFLLDEAVALLNINYLNELNNARDIPWTPLQNAVGRKPKL
ncbi:unnamed protein product [Soboliphyme baturini]|uniref:START domain-containing protein n=1 Tax=Soboliphyme baturini TaxID=241478 RepID=A0A183INK6_9BILA|nr:unnamed protein product [Soboliphyme baturini]